LDSVFGLGRYLECGDSCEGRDQPGMAPVQGGHGIGQGIGGQSFNSLRRNCNLLGRQACDV
jgi:hypothetical protein